VVVFERRVNIRISYRIRTVLPYYTECAKISAQTQILPLHLNVFIEFNVFNMFEASAVYNERFATDFMLVKIVIPKWSIVFFMLYYKRKIYTMLNFDI